MKIALVGGKLQGVEAAYLAGKAGWEVSLIDRDPNPPASGLCSHHIQINIDDQTNLEKLLDPFDLILPVLENEVALNRLKLLSQRNIVPVMFDFKAYDITSSKTASQALFNDLQIPMPNPYPECDFPVVVKPNRGSGSQGVGVFHHPQHLDAYLNNVPGQQVIQEFLSGPSYSLEIVGQPDNYRTLLTTRLDMDNGYDCKRVLAPSGLSTKHIRSFESIAISLAQRLALHGVMDIETILHDDELKLLEIDARLPSQTPTAVLASSGINIIGLLANLYTADNDQHTNPERNPRAVIYEHIRIYGNSLTVMGEHVMGSAGPLRLVEDFYGADEAIVSSIKNHTNWVATLILCADNQHEVCKKRDAVITDIQKQFGLNFYMDETPQNQTIRSSK